MDRYDAAALGLIVGGLAMFTVAQVGERLGWWNDFGEFLSIIGVVATAAGIVVAVILGATKTEVGLVRHEVQRVGEGVHHVGQEVHSANGKLDQANGKLDQVVDLLRDIRDRLPRA